MVLTMSVGGQPTLGFSLDIPAIVPGGADISILILFVQKLKLKKQ